MSKEGGISFVLKEAKLSFESSLDHYLYSPS